METIKIYIWPDGSWETEEEIDDMDWYLSSSRKSDDYAVFDIPIKYSDEDIIDFVESEGLSGLG